MRDMVSAKRVFDSFWKNHAKQAEAACRASCKGGVFSKKTFAKVGKRNMKAKRSSKAKTNKKVAKRKPAVPGTVKIGNVKVVPG